MQTDQYSILLSYSGLAFVNNVKSFSTIGSSHFDAHLTRPVFRRLD